MGTSPSPAWPDGWAQPLRPVADALARVQGRPCLINLHGSTPALATALLDPLMGDASWLILAPDDEAAARWHDDLRFFFTWLGRSTEPLVLFPEWETLPYEATPPPVELVADRMRTLHRLLRQERTVLVASMPALLQRLLPESVLREATFSLEPGAGIAREDLTSRLLRLGYRRVSVVEIPGEFSVRGGIVDVFSTAYDDPLRLEFLGDTAESIRRFDPSTQKSTQKLDRAWILPARESIRPAGDPDALAPHAPDAEWRGPDLYPSMPSLLEYFCGQPVVVLDQPRVLADKAQTFRGAADEAFARHRDGRGRPYPEPDRLYTTWDDLLGRMRAWPMLAAEPLTSPDETWAPVVPFPSHTPASAGLGQRGTPFAETLATLDRLRATGIVVLVARSRGQVDRLSALFAEHDLPVSPWSPSQWPTPAAAKRPFSVVQGDLSAGFVSAEGRLTIVTEEELFAKGARHRPAPKTKAAVFFTSLEDLNLGDVVVHVQHGIARYQGLKRLSVQDFDSDYLILEFAGGDRLYVPLDRLNQVQPYRGAEGHAPKLDRLGGTAWGRTTAKAKKDIEEMAHELIDLYANRELVQRQAYGGDSTLAREFDAAFEYEETPDQLKAIEDIKQDMESSKPMDRLVCGDVGYGKTEVAMRAAFKAVETGRQVAVAVPTTLLAQQHFENFSQRFAPFPVKVAMLSRFQTPKEAKATLKGLADGTVDIVVGTHRLFQKNVVFRNLGLVVIDEEQWFGVRHKERLKQLRTQVDVMTLTATPIPRTLQMAMSSVRDLSIIETPPAGRLATRTSVVRFGDRVVREAVVRELGRGGQIYFVHNRVQSIERMGTWLRELVPEARVVVAHGQMDERLLEAVMLKFLHREADVLVSTAIIQSGLDVPNANTILVHRADTFGLAQLYQLRGRVGRGGQQAYAYFFVPDEGTLTTDAQKRLHAIQEFTELGSGFRVAAADLEIRGAGNLLGRQQSGHIAAIGLDLYMQMVEQAVQRLRGTVVQEEADPALKLHVSAYVPDDYVPDSHQRLSLYKRLSAVVQVGDLAFLHGEIQDRYGTPPEPVERLFEVMQIRLLAKAARLASVEIKTGTVALAFDPARPLPEAGIRRLMDRYPHRLRLLSPTAMELTMPAGVAGTGDPWAARYPELTAALKTLAVCDT